MARFLWLFPSLLHVIIDRCTGWVIVKHVDNDTHKTWYVWERSEEYRG